MAKPAASYKPVGAHTVNPYLIVNDAAKALDWYRQVFGAVEQARMPGPDGKIMHAGVQIGDAVVYLSDEIMGSKSPATLGGTPVVMHMYVPDADATFQKAVNAGAQVIVPIADQFWGDRYGQVADPFGHQWAISMQKTDYTSEEMTARARDAMAQM